MPKRIRAKYCHRTRREDGYAIQLELPDPSQSNFDTAMRILNIHVLHSLGVKFLYADALQHRWNGQNSKRTTAYILVTFIAEKNVTFLTHQLKHGIEPSRATRDPRLSEPEKLCARDVAHRTRVSFLRLPISLAPLTCRFSLRKYRLHCGI